MKLFSYFSKKTFSSPLLQKYLLYVIIYNIKKGSYNIYENRQRTQTREIYREEE